jgi:chemotaxis protein MotB
MAKISLRGMRRRSVDFESLWLITFADLMVQLMAFFAVVYSFSIQDQRKLGDLAASLQKVLGVQAAKGGTSSVAVPGPAGQGILPGTTGILPDKAADLEKLLSDLRATEGPDVGTRMRLVTFRGSILFGEGSSAVDPVFEPLLSRMVQLAQEYPGFYLVCEGYAAPGERGRGNADSLELSGLRAQAVLRYLAAKGLDPKLMSAEAHGDAVIEGDPSSPEGRALQRRVKFRYQRPAER